MVSLDTIILRAPISSEHKFRGIIEVLSTRYDVINNHHFIIWDMSFHLFTWVMIHLDFLSQPIFSYPKNSWVFFILCRFTLDAQHWLFIFSSSPLFCTSFFPHPSYCLLCTLKYLPSIKHAIFVQFYELLKF